MAVYDVGELEETLKDTSTTSEIKIESGEELVKALRMYINRLAK